MLHFNSLEVYEDLTAKGFTHDQAKAHIDSMDNVFSNMYAHFASNKTVSVMGALIIAIGGFILAGMWNLSIEVKSIDSRLTHVSERVEALSELVRNK